MSWYLIMFDETVGDDLSEGESEWYLNEHMVEANSPRQAVEKLIEATVDLSVVFSSVPSKKTINAIYCGCSIINVGTVKPKVERINYVVDNDEVSII